MLIVARKRGFGTPLLYFLIYRLYLVWVKKFEKAILMIFYLYRAHAGSFIFCQPKSQRGQAVFSPCLDEENSVEVCVLYEVETSGLTCSFGVHCSDLSRVERL